MNIDEEGHFHFHREDLLNNLELLQCIYNVYGKQKMIDWILGKPAEENKNEEGNYCWMDGFPG